MFKRSMIVISLCMTAVFLISCDEAGVDVVAGDERDYYVSFKVNGTEEIFSLGSTYYPWHAHGFIDEDYIDGIDLDMISIYSKKDTASDESFDILIFGTTPDDYGVGGENMVEMMYQNAEDVVYEASFGSTLKLTRVDKVHGVIDGTFEGEFIDNYGGESILITEGIFSVYHIAEPE